MEAIVLAGGLGTRLREAVPDRPKCLSPVGGKPFLKYLLDLLDSRGFSRVVLSLGYKSEQVIRWVTANKTWSFGIGFSVEREALGTGGAILHALPMTRDERVYVFNGDTVFNADYERLSLLQGRVAVALRKVDDTGRYGRVRLSDDDVIEAFAEKGAAGEGLINAGVYLVDRRLFGDLALEGKFSFEKDVLEPLAGEGMVSGAVFDGYFLDIGIPEDYRKARREVPLLAELSRVSREVMASDAEYLLLDRDGVINVRRPGSYVTSPSEFEFIPGFKETLRLWSGRFRRIVVVTNQRGVGKGLMTEDDLRLVHERMLSETAASGGRIDGIFYCTSVSDEDPRRKPNTGLFDDVRKAFPEVKAERSVMVGDSSSDKEFAWRCGIHFIEFRYK